MARRPSSAPPIEEVLLALADAAWTGTVVVVQPRFRRRLFLEGGTLVGVASENPTEWLGQFLVGASLIDEEQLRQGLAGQEAAAVPLGVVLERSGAVDAAQLDRVLTAQAREVVCALFETPPLEVRTQDGVLPASHPRGLRLPLPELILEGIRRRIRRREVEGCLGGLEVVPRRVSSLEPPGLDAQAQRVLAAVDGSRDLEEIGLACHLPTFWVAEIVLRGVEAGFLAVRPAAAGPAEMSDELVLERAEELVTEGEFKRAWDLLRPLRSRPTHRDTFDHMEELLQRMETAVNRRGIGGSLVPRRLAAADAADRPLEPEVAYVLSRINGSWTLRQIQQIVPLEALHFAVIVDALVRRGLVELVDPSATPGGG